MESIVHKKFGIYPAASFLRKTSTGTILFEAGVASGLYYGEAPEAALLNKLRTQSSKIELGEIELWAMSDPHRAVNPDAKEARVKMIVTLNDGSTEKLQGYFSRVDSGDTWVFRGLGKLSAGLFPQTY